MIQEMLDATHIAVTKKHQIFDANMIKGLIGVSVAIISPMLDLITKVGQVIGVLGGLVLLGMSIRHKHLEIKLANKKLANKKHE
jgi:hypothetical protein